MVITEYTENMDETVKYVCKLLDHFVHNKNMLMLYPELSKNIMNTLDKWAKHDCFGKERATHYRKKLFDAV